MPKFLIDANLPYSSKLLLEELGFDALHVRDAGLNNFSDIRIFQYAQKARRMIITRDMDFADAIRFKPGKHHGIIVMRISYLMTAKQINQVLDDFMHKAPLGRIGKGLVILQVGRYRLRRK